jgi:hypothetical protein
MSGNRAAKKRQHLMRSMEVVHPLVLVLSLQMVGRVVDHAWTLESNITDLVQVKSKLECPSTSVQVIL